MPTDKPFVPQFGPNGAVMNAPGMTEKMRAEIKETQSPGYWWKAIVTAAGLLAFLMVGGAVLAFVLAPLAQRMAAQGNFMEAMGVAFLGAPAGLFLGVIAVSFVTVPLARWEIIRRPSATRKFAETPLAVRLGLAATEIAILLAALTTLFTARFDKFYWINLIAGLGAVVAICARMFLLKHLREQAPPEQK